ncbi:MAG TPA: LysE family translocator [Chlamydiales bacterium]|jgi:threonine/homoserine/homoserine lactone efflux protein|nr:LysE family translocator [Chlamydiales bacterium]
MDLSLFFKGFILGFSIAAPVGPIGVLCIRKTLQFGRLSGLFSGLGAAVADAVYAMIATFGLTLISNFLLAGQFWLQLIGGAFLIYLGIKTFIAKAKPNETSSEVSHKTLSKDFISTFFLTIINPVTILTYLAIFAGLGVSHNNGYYAHSAMIWLVFGVFIGSALWWLILSEGVTLFRKKVSQKVMTWVNRFAGLIIFGFGVVAWLSLA